MGMGRKVQDPLAPNFALISASLPCARGFAGAARLARGALLYVCALGSVLTLFRICSNRQAT